MKECSINNIINIYLADGSIFYQEFSHYKDMPINESNKAV